MWAPGQPQEDNKNIVKLMLGEWNSILENIDLTQKKTVMKE